MKNKFLVFFLVSGVFFFATTTLAADTEQPLAQLAGCTGADCGVCNVVSIANGLVKWLIGFVFLLFALLMSIAGVRLVMSAGNPGALQSAKDKFINALIGFLIILAAWLIIDTLMRSLVGTEGHDGELKTTGAADGWLFWSNIECVAQPTVSEGEVEYVDLDYDPESADGSDTATIPPGTTGSNCGTDESTLVSIPGQAGQRATSDTVSHFLNMQRALAGRGITLSVTSSYRSDATQTQIWDSCPVCQREGTVARPCSRGGNGSQHTSGKALDLSSSGSRCDIVNACRAEGAGFIMTYERSGHVHCDWGSSRGESLNISCPR